MIAWKRTAAILSIFIGIVASSAIAATVKGIVFEDENRNLVMDNSERGIPGVAVSNGVDVVTTTADGSYSLPVDDETVIFITKSRNYKTPVDKNNLPLFFYIHQPNGSPKMQFKGIAATGNFLHSSTFRYSSRRNQTYSTSLPQRTRR